MKSINFKVYFTAVEDYTSQANTNCFVSHLIEPENNKKNKKKMKRIKKNESEDLYWLK